jgi:DNA adenine methylase
MAINPLVKPFLKWAGGKRYLLPEIRKCWPASFNNKKNWYFEPFLGGGAVLFSFQPTRAKVNDMNEELINCYRVVQLSVDELIACLRGHRNEEDYYYQVRDWDRSITFSNRTPIERAARIIYLNKTCYNGLFRVNQQGQFNVPFGRYKDPNIVDDIVLRAVSRYLNEADIEFRVGDFGDAVEDATKGDFLYFDPPYDSETDPASFTGYSVQGFDNDEQLRLSALVEKLNLRGCRFLLSNAYTTRTDYLYRGFSIEKVEVPRPINSNATKRGKVQEILVRNYGERKRTPKRLPWGSVVSEVQHSG